MLYIITPCQNPDNLIKISETIPNETKWIICHHKKKLPKGLRASIIKCGQDSTKDMLNYVLNNRAFRDDDRISYLLDDNVIYPYFYNAISQNLSKDFSIMQWGQVHKDGSIRLPPLSYCLPGSIDVSSFLISWKHNKDVRFKDIDNMFAHYAMDCHKNGGCLMIQNYISYYKYLA